MNGLARRLEVLERLAGPSDDPYMHAEGEESIRRMANLASRLRGTPAPPDDQQSAAERVVRAGLNAAAGYEGTDYARRFWHAVAKRLREWDRRNAA